MENEAKIFGKALAAALEGKEEERQKEIVRNFLQVAVAKKKEHLLPKILKEMEAISKEKEAVLILARDMGEEEVEAIKSRLKPELGKVDKFKIQIDKSIIGGFKAKTNNVLIDSSIKTLIGSIRKKLV